MPQPGCILVVDDQLELGENIVEILQLSGFDAEVAASAEQGLARIRRGGIALLITDFKLAGSTGVHLLETLRREGSPIPAVVMSAYTDDRTVVASHAAGARLFLPKPVPLGALVQSCRALLEEAARAPRTARV